MSTVTTESGQARRDLIAMFEDAQQLAAAERKRAAGLQAVIRRAVSNSSITEDERDVVDVRMPLTDWQALRSSARDEH
jgi:hypothetical protein